MEPFSRLGRFCGLCGGSGTISAPGNPRTGGTAALPVLLIAQIPS